MNTADKILEVRNLDYTINNKYILKDINFKVKKGEFLGLIGPNGAGKSTLLKCLSGLNTGSGSIKINGYKLSEIGIKEIAKRISLMHQNTLVTFPFPVIDVVLMGRYPYLGKLQNESNADYIIARQNMQITDTIELEERQITNISGGERQRVFFAKTLTQETDILLLDEPTANLDITHQERIFSYARELALHGKTIIAAVHDLKIAARYCDRVILMKDGCILSDGSPEDVITSANLFTAYGVQAKVYRNYVSGHLDFYINRRKEDIKQTIHIIGGGGSASEAFRYLFEKGYTLSAGVLWKGDRDFECAEIFGVKIVKCDPFCEITDELYNRNVTLIQKSDYTVLCNIPFGYYNLKNLNAAKHARELIILEDEAPEDRDFTKGRALSIYHELKHNAIVTSSARIQGIL